VLTGHTVLSAEADGDRLRLRVQRDDGRVIDQTTEHLIAGTGYRVDLSRLSFLGDQLRWRLRLVAGAPAHSLGPAMRFLYGADYSARRLVRHLLARAAGRHSWRRPCGGPWCHLLNLPYGAEVRALVTMG
jgi:hypothetical protein